MPLHDLVRLEAGEWLMRAQADYRASQVLRDAGLYAESLFHSQQCAEKALKTVLTLHQIAFRKTHDLDALKQACLEVQPSLSAAAEGIETLSRYAWQYRYPGSPYEPDLAECDEAISHAATLPERVKSYFPPTPSI